ncbi:interferon lambda-3-like [Liasis olivaceus]
MDPRPRDFSLHHRRSASSPGRGPGKWILPPLALVILLEALHVHSLPVGPCRLPQIPSHREAFRKLRNQYEDERVRGAEPWKNCSRLHLQFPRGKMHRLTNKWEKLEAVEAELALAVPVLWGISEPAFSRHTSQILEFLVPFKDDLAMCVRHNPSHHQTSSLLRLFKEEIQKFNTSSVQQSPKCLEAAVGLNIVRLLEEDIGQLRHHFHRRPHHHRASH